MAVGRPLCLDWLRRFPVFLGLSPPEQIMTSSFRDAEHSGWSARADSYDRMFTPISNQAIPRMIALLGDLRGKRVLDICCGSGHLTAALANKGATAEGID